MVKGTFQNPNLEGIFVNFLDLALHTASVGTGSSFCLPEGLIKAQFEEGATVLKEMEAASVAGNI